MPCDDIDNVGRGQLKDKEAVLGGLLRICYSQASKPVTDQSSLIGSGTAAVTRRSMRSHTLWSDEQGAVSLHLLTVGNGPWRTSDHVRRMSVIRGIADIRRIGRRVCK
jgi:hypothetical protein